MEAEIDQVEGIRYDTVQTFEASFAQLALVGRGLQVQPTGLQFAAETRSEPNVELDIVANDGVGAEKFFNLGGDRRKERRPFDLLRGDVSQPLDELGYGDARIDQGLVGLNDFVAAKPNCADL